MIPISVFQLTKSQKSNLLWLYDCKSLDSINLTSHQTNVFGRLADKGLVNRLTLPKEPEDSHVMHRRRYVLNRVGRAVARQLRLEGGHE